MCQRPKRALFISTDKKRRNIMTNKMMCQRPKRALFISTDLTGYAEGCLVVCQRPKRALFISTGQKIL